eukprot:NODE_1887_length_1265_cov_135.994243_g1560_i0.p1 GENE.NODE_1887_length_1265_cov_135.994243_g1560_i0~~NODE_1887_length_1265_cov_135.994243_g1560_i0.p1  ORF type:complete len:246 (+),score=134.69 NODE_1887_length_1265_cov_135.994243_g1560_i0:145-882(+)
MAALRLLALAAVATLCAASDYGILNLDNATLDKIVDGKRPAFLRFDREYSYGDKHNAYKDLAIAVAEANTDLVIGNVGIGTYGEKLNQDLAERFGLKAKGKELEYTDLDNEFPKFLFFPKGVAASGAPVKFEKEVSLDAFLRFLSQKGVKLGLKGTIPALNDLAAKFLGASEADRKASLKAVSDNKEDGADYYAKVMEKIAEKGNDFVKKEIKRLENLMSTALSAAKKESFKKRTNVLTAFLPSE